MLVAVVVAAVVVVTTVVEPTERDVSHDGSTLTALNDEGQKSAFNCGSGTTELSLPELARHYGEIGAGLVGS